MGYYVQTNEVDFFIPATKIPDAFQTLRDLNDPKFDELKHGGSWSGGKRIAAWYSWMNGDWHITCKSVKDIFELLGFEGCTEDGLGFRLGNYDSKTGQQELFLAAVAKYAMPGKIEWQGEDGSRWALMFDKGKMETVARESLTWDDDLEEYV